MLQIQLTNVYVIGAAGFWLGKNKGVAKSPKIDEHRRATRKAWQAYVDERRRIESLAEVVLSPTT